MAADCRLIVHGLIVTFLFAAGPVDDNLHAETDPVGILGPNLDSHDLDIWRDRHLVRGSDRRRRSHPDCRALRPKARTLRRRCEARRLTLPPALRPGR